MKKILFLIAATFAIIGNPASAATNWDQGSLSLWELEKLLAVILQKEHETTWESSPAASLRGGTKPDLANGIQTSFS